MKRFTSLVALVLTLVMALSGIAFARPISNELTATFNVGGAMTVTDTAGLTAALTNEYVTTINLAAGDFTGQFVVNRNVTINGSGKDKTYIKAPAEALQEKFVATKFAGTEGRNESIKPILYVAPGNNVTIKNLTVDGLKKGATNNHFAGIAFNNADGMIDTVQVVNISHDPVDGVQNGTGIWVDNSSGTHAVTVQNSVLSGYQKRGIVFRGVGMTATAAGNELTGTGQKEIIASNGIQLMDGAAGTITGNTLTGHQWDGNTAAGVVLYGAATTGVTVSGNHYSNNDVDMSNNAFENPVTLTGYVQGVDTNGADRQDFGAGTLTFAADKSEQYALSITAHVNGVQEFYNANLILKVTMPQNGGVTVTVGGQQVTGVGGVFDIGDVVYNSEYQTLGNIIITFTEVGQYAATIAVDEVR